MVSIDITLCPHIQQPPYLAALSIKLCNTKFHRQRAKMKRLDSLVGLMELQKWYEPKHEHYRMRL